MSLQLENTRAITIDDIQFYLARGAKLHPHTYDLYLSNLEMLKRSGKLSYTPSIIFERYMLHLESLNIPQKIAI